jgi:hypothetical protein
MSHPGAFASAGAKEQEGCEPPSLADGGDQTYGNRLPRLTVTYFLREAVWIRLAACT